MRSIIIEGVDRLGKDTLIQGLKNQLGFFQVLHYQKPEVLPCHLSSFLSNFPVKTAVEGAQRRYQYDAFDTMFHLLGSQGRFILNRAHLGETVYAHRYRGYSGDYVFTLEHDHLRRNPSVDQTLLVWLYTSDFSFIADDGESFNFAAKQDEQLDFERAFNRSQLTHKLALDVNDGGKFADKDALLGKVIHLYQTHGL